MPHEVVLLIENQDISPEEIDKARKAMYTQAPWLQEWCRTRDVFLAIVMHLMGHSSRSAFMSHLRGCAGKEQDGRKCDVVPCDSLSGTFGIAVLPEQYRGVLDLSRGGINFHLLPPPTPSKKGNDDNGTPTRKLIMTIYPLSG